MFCCIAHKCHFMTTFCFHEKLTQDTCQIKGRAELENPYHLKVTYGLQCHPTPMLG